jgi:hypothetical protein
LPPQGARQRSPPPPLRPVLAMDGAALLRGAAASCPSAASTARPWCSRWAIAPRSVASNGAAAVPCHAAPSGGAWPPTTLRCPRLTQAVGGGGRRLHFAPLDRRGQGVLLRRRRSIQAVGGWTTSGQRERRGPGLLLRRRRSCIASAAPSRHAKPPPQKTPAHSISWGDPTLGARRARCPSRDAPRPGSQSAGAAASVSTGPSTTRPRQV